MSDEDEVVEGEIIPTSEEIIEAAPKENGGKWLNFDEMTKEERQEMSRRGLEARRARRKARQLATLEAYTQAHRELASQVLGTKMVILDGLVEEMTVVEEDGSSRLDTAKLDDKRLKVLIDLLSKLEKTAFPTTTKVEHTGAVDIRHVVAQISKGLSRPDK